MERFYKIACLFLALMAAVALVLTVVTGVSGSAPTSGRAGLIIVIVCLSLTAVMTIFGVFLFKVGGNLPHKIGFYIMHIGAVVLISGFILTELGTYKAQTPVVDDNGDISWEDGSVFEFDRAYSSVPVGKRNLLEEGQSFVVESEGTGTEYYDDGMPKEYRAVICVKDKSGVDIEKKTLLVNHPQYINGCKIYLMSLPTPGSAVLLIKYNPGEYIVLIGIVALVAGTFLSCITGAVGKRKENAASDKRKGETS